MNWYKSFEKTAQHSNVEVYTYPQVDTANPYGNSEVDVIHVPDDPYYKQKDPEREYQRKYEYFLGERNRISKRTAVDGVNRLAQAINALVQARRSLSDALESDEYKSLRRLVKSIVVKSDNDDEVKTALLSALGDIETFNSEVVGIEKGLPISYNVVSTYVDDWIRKNQDKNVLQRNRFVHNSDGSFSDTLPFKK